MKQFPKGWQTTAGSTLDEKARREKESAAKPAELKNHHVPNEIDTDAEPDKGGSTHTTARSKVEARIDMGDGVAGKGMCPACKEPMIASHASGIPVLACIKDRIALPRPNAVMPV